jgi:hypothetical protein
LINNRQGGRRRGRGGQRNPNLGGNRQDNRQRGNAAQLLEKYKNMARDAQLAGDRVQSEYYLQFADHYFRMLGENRPRVEDQRRDRDDDSDDDDNDDEMMDASEDEQQDRGGGNDRNDRSDNDRNDRNERSGNERTSTQRTGSERSDNERSGNARSESGPRSNGRGRPQRNGVRQEASNDEDQRIALDVLPPAIGRDSGETNVAEEPAEKPKRRARKPRNDGDADIAPAA